MAYEIVGADMGVMGPEIVGYDEFAGDMFTGDADIDALVAMGAGAMRRPHHAHRPVGKAYAVEQKNRNVWREQSVPLNLAAGPTGTVTAGATVIVSTTLQKMFRPNRFILDSGVAGGYVINDIRVGVLPQLAATGSMPGRMFTEFAVGIGLHGDTGYPGIQLSVSVTNITGAALTFVSAFQGIAVE
jgi:hypothetical protein